MAAMNKFVLHLFLVVVACQWATLQCRSGQWDNFNEYSRGNRYESSSTSEYSDNSFSTQMTTSEMPSFAANPNTEPRYDYSAGNAGDGWTLPDSFSTRTSAETFPEGQDDTVVYTTYNTNTDSETNDESSLANQQLYNSHDRFHRLNPASSSADDEVFFDTSSAKTVYKAPAADGLSFSSQNVSTKTPDDMLASVASAMGGCGTGNPIDDCWRCDPNWRSHRQNLANCAIGFGRNAMGGKNGPIYVVTNNGDDAQNPAPGTLRYGVTRAGPLWITFAGGMNIQLKAELLMTSYKTIDGRGATVHITGGSQITIQGISHVIIHGLHIHDIHPSGPSTILASSSNLVSRGVSDGDGIHVWNADNVWVDHCYLANAADGLIDCTRGSTAITISNNYFTNHNKVMLFGSHPTDFGDRSMRITVAYNKFGPGLTQRMPRCRFGSFHVVNNDYSAGWGIYAIGGSEDPTILSEGNYFNPAGGKTEVTKRINDGGSTFGGWQKWNWGSSGDIFLGGAYFTGSGATANSAGVYAQAYSLSPRPGQLVPAMTAGSGPLTSL